MADDEKWTWAERAIYWALMFDARTGELHIGSQRDLTEMFGKARPNTISEACRSLEKRGLINRLGRSRRLRFNPPEDITPEA